MIMFLIYFSSILKKNRYFYGAQFEILKAPIWCNGVEVLNKILPK